jgi:hypothetical protein
MALEPDIRGVCNSGGTFVITKARKGRVQDCQGWNVGFQTSSLL